MWVCVCVIILIYRKRRYICMNKNGEIGKSRLWSAKRLDFFQALIWSQNIFYTSTFEALTKGEGKLSLYADTVCPYLNVILCMHLEEKTTTNM